MRQLNEQTLRRALGYSPSEWQQMREIYRVAHAQLVQEHPELVRAIAAASPGGLPHGTAACRTAPLLAQQMLAHPLTADATLSPGSTIGSGPGGEVQPMSEQLCRNPPLVACIAVCGATIPEFPIFLLCEYGCFCSFCDDATMGGACG